MVERVGLYMANLRPKIVKLAKMVGGVAGAMNRIDEKAPEYYALNAVVTDDMADVALVMGLRQPRTFEYIVEKCGRSREETKKLLDQLTYTGVVKVWTDKKDKKDRYFINIFAPGMLEMMVNNREQLAAHPEIGKAFEEYTRKRIAPMAPLFPEGMATVSYTHLDVYKRQVLWWDSQPVFRSAGPWWQVSAEI